MLNQNGFGTGQPARNAQSDLYRNCLQMLKTRFFKELALPQCREKNLLSNIKHRNKSPFTSIKPSILNSLSNIKLSLLVL